MIRFDAQPIELQGAEGEESARTISGIAVPWNTPATVMSGEKVQFERGAFDLAAKPKLLEGHDMNQLRGVVTELADSDQGLQFTAKFANTRASNDAIALVKLGAYDSVSVGAQPIKFRYDKAGTMVVSQADVVEISLVAMPAFKQAVITDIAASEPDEASTQDTEGEIEVSDQTPAVEAEAPAVIPTQPLVVAAAPAKPFVMPSAAEYISKVLQGGAEAQEFLARVRAAAPDVTTSETPGLLPEPIVGPVYDNFRGLRPIVDAIGTKAMPQGGKSFRRPYVKTHTSIGASNGENQALDPGVFEVDEELVTKAVYGGYVKLSEEDQEWTDPAVLSLLIADMARVYAYETDAVAASGLATESANNTESFDVQKIDDPVEWVRWMYAASQNILADSNGWLPTHLFMSPLRWSQLGSLVDQEDRPLFPQVGPMNAYGNVTPGSTTGNAFGFTIVVDRALTDEMILGHPDGFEIYEQQKGALSVEAADGSLSRYIKFRGYFATLMLDVKKFKRALFE